MMLLIVQSLSNTTALFIEQVHYYPTMGRVDFVEHDDGNIMKNRIFETLAGHDI